MSRYKNIVFDVGSVLNIYSDNNAYANLFKTDFG